MPTGRRRRMARLLERVLGKARTRFLDVADAEFGLRYDDEVEIGQDPVYLAELAGIPAGHDDPVG